MFQKLSVFISRFPEEFGRIFKPSRPEGEELKEYLDSLTPEEIERRESLLKLIFSIDK